MSSEEEDYNDIPPVPREYILANNAEAKVYDGHAVLRDDALTATQMITEDEIERLDAYRSQQQATAWPLVVILIAIVVALAPPTEATARDCVMIAMITMAISFTLEGHTLNRSWSDLASSALPALHVGWLLRTQDDTRVWATEGLAYLFAIGIVFEFVALLRFRGESFYHMKQRTEYSTVYERGAQLLVQFGVAAGQSIVLYQAAEASVAITHQREVLGFTLAFVGVVVQIIATYEKVVQPRDGFQTGGLWSMCRHPTMFGYLSFWLGLALTVGTTFATFVGIVTTVLVIRRCRSAEEARAAKTGQSLFYYQTQVPSLLIPRPSLPEVADLFTRKYDLFFAGFFVFALYFALFMDLINALAPGEVLTHDVVNNLPWPPACMKELFLWWGDNYDPLLTQNPFWLSVLCAYSPLFHAPMYLIMLYGLLKKSSWLKMAGMSWAAFMTATIIPILLEGTRQSEQPIVFLAAYGGYLLVPVLFAIRVSRRPLF